MLHVNTAGPVSIHAGSMATLENQRRIADLAYEFWLARRFQNGSPEEDLLRALCAVSGSQTRHHEPLRFSVRGRHDTK